MYTNEFALDWREKFHVDLWVLWSKVKVPMTMLAVNFFISLGIYPGTVTQIQSTDPNMNTTAWFAIIQIARSRLNSIVPFPRLNFHLFVLTDGVWRMQALFNVFDFVGKLIPKWYSYDKLPPKIMHIINVSRIGFWIIFIAGAKGVFQNDFISYIIISIFALINGFSGSTHTLCRRKKKGK
jgi:hypothetical protein